MTIHEAHQLLKSKQLSSVELTRAYLERIHQVDPEVHSFVTITDELALRQAQKADELIAAGDTNPLTGIPVLIKDNICLKGIRTTCS
ncbi:MAG: amidase family protein, partial [Dehalococcoidales bacterium]